MWESKTDIGGSVFDLSTSYYLLTKNRLTFKEDNEVRNRFYNKKLDERVLPHRCTFAVWKKSMNLRYLIEAIIYVLILVVFQYEISLFNKDLHLAIREMHEFDLLHDLILERGGKPFDPENPDANKHLLEQRDLLERKLREEEDENKRQR